jgi:N-acylneuraminate cytidylyltransferase
LKRKTTVDSERVLALIPAKGRSSGIPRKNLLTIAGKPLIAHSILHALSARRISRVLVSTDDAEIADVALEWGAEVPFLRPAELARDDSPDIDVFRHTLTWLRSHEEELPEMVVHLRPTSPVRRVEAIDRAIEILSADPEADALRSLGQAEQSPYKMWRLDSNGYMEPLVQIDGVADCQSLPRQRLPQVYWQNGYVDVLRPRAVLARGSMWGERVIPFPIEEPTFDLDYPEDIPAVEQALQRLKRGESLGRPDSPRHAV